MKKENRLAIKYKIIQKMTKAIHIVIITIIAGALQPVRSQDIQQIKNDWHAQWIGPEPRVPSDHEIKLADVHWIWGVDKNQVRFSDPALDAPTGTYYFRKNIFIPDIEQINSATLYITADNRLVLFVNGNKITTNNSWEEVQRVDIRTWLKQGQNSLAVEAHNTEVYHTSFHGGGKSPAGLVAKLEIRHSDGPIEVIRTDDSWKASATPDPAWVSMLFDDSRWKQAYVMNKKGLSAWEGAGKDANTWYCYRKTMHIHEVPEKAVANIAADSKYWLWVNNKPVVFEGGLKRGPTPDDTYYDEVDLSDFMQQGDNTIAVLVWYWGRNGYCHKSSGQAGLLFELDLGGQIVGSNSSWKIKQHPAFGFTDEPHPNYRLPEYNIHFDARRDKGSWYAMQFDDASWETPHEFGIPEVAPWNALWKRPFPLWYDSGLLAYENDKSWQEEHVGDPVVMKLPNNLAVTPYMKIDAPAGLTIDMRTDNYIGGSEPNIRAEYITREGIQEFEALAYMNGHEMIYSIPKGIRILDLKYRETRLNTTFSGSFTCDDPFFDTLWIKAHNTMNLNMRDAIQDADRERAQWWGDAVIVLGEMFYSCDTTAYGLIRKCMSNLVEWQKQDGVLFSPIPGKWEAELPLQMLASIGRYGFWRYYMYTGDTSMIRYVYPHVKKYLSLWHLGKDDLVEHRTGDWDWGDWGQNKDRPLMDNSWYVMALEAAIEMAKISGDTESIPGYEKRIFSISSNFDKTFWTGTEYRSTGYTDETDDRGHGLAVVSGLSDPALWLEIKEVLGRAFHASPYTEKYVLESFFIRNDATTGLQRMKERYRAMVNHPWCTTLWEGWGIGPEGYGGGSYNHGWAGGPLTLLSEYVGGVAPDKPGYTQYHILPQLGHLKSVKVVVPTIKGTIHVSHQLTEREFTTTITSPEATTAIVGIPKSRAGAIRQVKANGYTVWEKGIPLNLDGFSFVEEDEQYMKFQASPGEWFIQAKLKHN